QVGATSAPQLVSITNGGSVPLNLFSIGAQSQFPTTPACPATVAPGATCAVLVQFAPDVQGTITGTLAIDSNAPSSPDSVALAGNGVPSPIGTLQARPAGLSFPGTNIGATSEAQTVTITNVGGADAVIASIAADADFSVTGACGRLAPAASCSLAVRFSPTAR